MITFFALLLLFLAVAMAFTLAEEWDQIRRQFIRALVTAIILVLTGLLLLQYSFTYPTDCAPNCVGSNLVGRDLRGEELNGVNFVEANMSNANLAGAQLVEADLSGANLMGASLEGANLQNAYLMGADLTNVNLAGANLTGANLGGANLTGANLTAVDLTQTVLKGAQLIQAQLVGVNLSNTDLSAIQLADAKMNGARLNNANLSGAVLSGADLSGAHLTNSNLSGAWLNRTSLVGADLTNSDLAGSSLVGADLASAELNESNLVGSILVGADLKGSNLNAANLSAVILDVAALPTTALTRDPKLADLTILQRTQILVDARLDGAGSDGQTVWPNDAVAERFAGVQTIALEAATPTVTDTIKVGLLYSLSGSLAISELPIRDAVLLAIDEINAAGGVLGKPLTPILADSASSPELSAEKALKLIEDDGVVVIFGCLSSACRKAVLPVVEAEDKLLFYPAAYEGFESSPNIFYTGADPSQLMLPSVEYLLAQKYTNILLVGTDYVFPRAVNTIVKARLAATNLQPADEVYFPLGATDFSKLITQLKATPPQVIYNTMVGDSNIQFFQQLAAAGLTPQKLPVLSITIAEEEIQAIGPTVMVGHLIGGNYFQTIDTPENLAFVTAFKSLYGQERVTTNSVESGYTAVYLWKALVQAAQSTATMDIQHAAVTNKIEFAAPEGPLQIDGKTHHVYKTARVGVVRDNGQLDEVYVSPQPIKPDPFLTGFPWAEGLEEEIDQE